MRTVVLVSECPVDAKVIHNDQAWRVGGLNAKGERILYGITRRSIAYLPASALVELRS